MTYKILILSALVAVVRAGIVAQPPVVAAKIVDTNYDPNPQYTYAYDVQDSLTGDSKNQFETRNGDVVRGRYSLIEPDGTRRTVDYTADSINGFNAIVQREPVVNAAVVAPVARVAPVIAPAPIAVARYAQPVAAPFVTAKVAAPVATPFLTAASFGRFAQPVAVPAVAKVAAPLLAAPLARVTQPFTYPIAAKVAAPLVAPSPFAKIAAPLTFPAQLAYSSPISSPFARVAAPFGYAPYNTVF